MGAVAPTSPLSSLDTVTTQSLAGAIFSNLGYNK